MFKPIVSGNFRPRPSQGQRPGNSFTTPKTSIMQNNNGFQIFEIEDPQSSPNQPNFIQTQTVPQTVQQQQPSTETSINLINSLNNFGLDLSRQPQPTQAPNVVVENPTRVQATPTTRRVKDLIFDQNYCILIEVKLFPVMMWDVEESRDHLPLWSMEDPHFKRVIGHSWRLCTTTRRAP